MDKTKKFVITINRELGSGGRLIGKELATRLGVKFYDKALVEELTKKFDISVKELEKIKAQKHNWLSDFAQQYINNSKVEERFNVESNALTTANIFKKESKILLELAAEESCVIAGRSGFFVFRDEPNSLKIFIQSTMEKRIKHVMATQNLTRNEAVKAIEKVDAGRETYTKKFSSTSRYYTHNYDLVLNVANLTKNSAVEIIMDFINKQN